MVKLLIADDHTIMRDGLKALLDNEQGIEVVATAADGLDAIRKASELIPDVIIMDISMPGTDGIEAVRSIKRKNSNIGIVILTFHKEEHFVRGALDAGADSYVLKDESRGLQNQPGQLTGPTRPTLIFAITVCMHISVKTPVETAE